MTWDWEAWQMACIFVCLAYICVEETRRWLDKHP